MQYAFDALIFDQKKCNMCTVGKPITSVFLGQILVPALPIVLLACVSVQKY